MTSAQIKEKACQLGFSACGIIPAAPFEEYRKALDERVKAFPQSKELYAPLYGLVNPPENGKSIIICISGFSHYKVPESMAKHIGKFYLFDVRLPYAEEHRATSEFTTYLKNSGAEILKGGIPDRWAAAKAGLGKFGRNNFFYTQKHGSYNYIHTWMVDAEFAPDPIHTEVIAPECTEKCLKCVKSCPTNALCGNLQMDRGKCIPQLANDRNTLPTPEEMQQMGTWQYGCDACQDICPMNKNKLTQTHDFPLLAQYEDCVQPENLLEMDQKTYVNIINPRFWYLGEDNLWLWKVNALRVMINSNNPKYRPLIEKYSTHEDPRLREVALWGLSKAT